MNGALTIGTLDGTNIEIRDAVGAENFFLFGLTANQVRELREGSYDPRRYYESDSELRESLDGWIYGEFSGGDTALFRPLYDSLLDRDEYMLLADYRSYVDCQHSAGQVFLDREKWNRMSVMNIARTGRFSSDGAIREYCKDIWRTGPIADNEKRAS